MERKVVFDSNILIAWFKKKLDRDSFILLFSSCRWIISEITEIELLSYSEISAQEETDIRKFLRKCKIVRLSRTVKAETIRLRRAINRKLPDSVIAATAVLSKATLISNDLHLLKASYPGLIVEPFGEHHSPLPS
jgi:predicted nucleic acid-binding protein